MEAWETSHAKTGGGRFQFSRTPTRDKGWKTARSLVLGVGKYIAGHGDFTFPSWEEHLAETQMGLKTCESNSSKQFLEASSSFRLGLRYLGMLCSSILFHRDNPGDPHTLLTLTTAKKPTPLNGNQP